MSDVNANINISINSQQALGQLRALQNQITAFNQSVVAGNVAAVQKQRDLTRDLTAQINATKAFTTSISNVETSVSRLGTAIDKNKLSLREYFRYGVAASGTMGKGMKEHAAIMELAGERVKRLQTQYIALEQAHNGYTRSLAVRPTHLFNADSAIAIQRQQIFNKLLGDGSTALVNWGKNTQWAGRQLMVGFTVPLTIFGGIAGKIFMDLEKQVVQFKRVYGDLQTPTSERNAMVEEVKGLAKEFTKYGIAVSDTVALAAKAAATGAQGEDLLAATTQATRLATLGQIDYQQALDATISLQTALGVSSNELAQATDFLNAVENQTVTSLDDITQAIPLVAPVVKGLGGDVKDLAIFMTAMREGGISANEGANALKSGLASLINPTRGAKEQLEKVGINIDAILSKNKGDLRGLVMEFGEALGTLGKFERQQTLAKMFGKYQFSRMGALFSNISKEGSQAARVMDLTAMSAKELGQIAEGELSQLEESVGVKFTAAVEKLKLAIAPIGEAFLKIATPIIDFAAKIADAFNNLPDAAKTFITWGTAIGGVLVPTVIMLVGLLGNFAGNMLKIGAAIGRLMGKTSGLSSGLEYLTMEELDAMAASASLEGQTNSLTGALNVQRSAVNALAGAYGNYVAAAGAAAANLPQGFRGRPAMRMATGGVVPGTGNKDTVPALLTPGESVINKKASKQYGPILSAMNSGTLRGLATGDIQVGVPGSWEAAHFGGQGRMTGQELLDWSSNKSQAVRERIRQLVDSVEDGVNHVFTTLDNRVTALSRDVNQAVGKTGSGKTVDKALARRDLVDRGDIAHIELVRQLKSAKVPVQEIKGIVARLTSEIATGFDELGDVTAITAEDIDRITDEAYQKVAAADDRVDAAYARMKDVTTVVDPTARGGRQERVNLQGAYKTKRGTYNSQMAEVATQPIPYNPKGAIKITEGIATRLGATRQEIAAAFSTLEDSVKMRLASIVGNAEDFSTVMAAELRAAGVTLAEAALDGQRRGFRSSSPSEAAAEIGDDVPRGTAMGIERSTPIAVAAASEMSDKVQRELHEAVMAGGGYGPSSPIGGGTGLTNRFVPSTMPSSNPSRKDMGFGEEEEKVKKGLKGFGGKLMGGMFAMDGLLFAMSMMEGGVGEFAQKIMPAAFALQGVSMMLPLLSNPVGATIAALVAVSAGLWFLNSRVDNLKEDSRKLSEAMYGSTQSLNSMAEFFGKKTWQQKLAAAAAKASGANINEERATKAQEFVASESGTQLLENLKMTSSTLGRSSAVKAMQNNLQRMILEGIVNPSTASAIAIELGTQLGDYKIGTEVVANINQIIGPNGERIRNLDDRLRIAADITGDTAALEDAFARAGLQWDGASWYTQVAMIVKGEGTADLFAEGAVADIKNKMGVYQTEMNRVQLMFQNGQITAQQYQEKIAQIFDQSKVVNWSNTVADAQKLFGDQFLEGETAFNNLADSFGDSLQQSVQSALGEDKLEKFKEVMQETVGLRGAGERKINLLDADEVAWAVDQLNAAGQENKALELLRKQKVAMDLAVAVQSPNFPMSALESLLSGDDVSFDAIASLAVKYDDPTAQAIASIAAGILKPESYLSMLIETRLDSGAIDAAGNWLQYALEAQQIGVDLSFITSKSETQALKEAIDDVRRFNELPSPITKRGVAKFWEEGYELTDEQMRAFMALPDGQKKQFFSIYRTIIAEPERMSAEGAKALAESTVGSPTGTENMYISPADKVNAGVQETINQALGLDEDKGKKPPGAKPPGGGSNSGGGNREKTWLEQRIEEMKANSRLYATAAKWVDKLKKERGLFFGRIQQLRTGTRVVKGGKVKGGFTRLPEQLIEEIGAGPEGLKRLQELLGLSKKAFNTFVQRWKDEVMNRTVDMMRSEVYSNNRAKRAESILTGQIPGLSPNQLDEFKFTQDQLKDLMSNPEWVEGFLNALKKGKRAANEYLTWTKKWVESLEDELESETLDKAVGLIDDAFSILEDQINLKFDNIIKPLEKQITLNEDLIEVYQKQVDAKEEQINDQERLNDLDQQAIEGYNRDIEMQNRKIEALRREDEIRQRTADALQKELDLMSRSEQTIRDAYQKRIDALDAVAKLNDRILQSQQDQLNIGKALSEGDVYAAAQAAAEMQRNSVQYAADQNRAALEQGMENQVAGLRTSGGMTRAQAEAQIQAIQDQSYQTQLAIRDIEDYIYNLKQTKILPLEDAIYTRTLTIRDLQNEIYDINENSIEPLEIKNKDLEVEIKSKERLRDLALEEMVIGEFTRDAWEQRKNELDMATVQAELNALALGRIEQKYKDIANAARDAAAQIANIPGASAPSAATGSATGNASSAAAMGIENPFGFAWAWNTGGRIMKYAAGSVVGAGGGDKVQAMLSPGEFVIRKAMVDKYGLPLFEDINQGSFSMPKYGGFGKQTASISSGGRANVDATIAPVYNTYSVHVNASTNASPDDIANTVINKIRSIDNMSVRRINGY